MNQDVSYELHLSNGSLPGDERFEAVVVSQFLPTPGLVLVLHYDAWEILAVQAHLPVREDGTVKVQVRVKESGGIWNADDIERKNG